MKSSQQSSKREYMAEGHRYPEAKYDDNGKFILADIQQSPIMSVTKFFLERKYSRWP